MKIEYFEATWDTVLIRFFLMMAVIIGGVFAGQYWLAALGLPLFLSALMAPKITFEKPKSAAKVRKMKVAKKAQIKQAA
ncbi:MAG: hypothetical protein AAF806_16800 [Bacteroidota bacterium]